MTEVAAYVAGFLDGEGCFTTRYHIRRSDGRRRYDPLVIASQITREPLDVIREHYPGYITNHTSGGTHAFNLRWCGATRLWPLLLDIEPYVIVKRRHVETLLDFLELVGTDDHAGRERLARRLTKLNERRTRNRPT